MTHRNRIAVCIIFFIHSAATADDWPQFLGPHRNGKSAETGLISRIPETGIKPQWRVTLGEGMSGISVVGNHVVTMYQDDKNQYVVCLNRKDGTKTWKTAVAPHYQNSMGHGPRATPTVVDGKVYSFSGEGILTALSLDKGKILWSKNPQTKIGAKPAEYGMSSSPLVLGNEVIVHTSPGAQGYSIVAYSKDKGEFKWGTMRYAAGYSSPTLFEVNNVPHIMLFSGEALVGVEPVTGRAVWEYPFPTEYNCNTASPIMVGKRVFISSGENHGSALLSVNQSQGDKPTYTVKEKWTSFGRDSVMRSEWQTPIYHEGHLFGFDNVGSAGPISNLVCIDARTGKRKWIEKRFGKGNLIFADGKLIISTMKGQLIMVEANPEKYVELGKQKIIGQTRQAPALSNGQVFLRDNREIVCVDVNK